MSLVTDLALLVLIAYLIYSLLVWLNAKRRQLKVFRQQGIPGPKPSFFTGNFNEYLHLPHETLDQWCKLYGPYYGFYQGTSPILVLSDIEDVQEVLVKYGKQLPNRQKPFINVEPFKSCLIGLRDTRWKHSRRVLTPTFTAHKMAMQATKDAINLSVSRMLQAIERKRAQSGDLVNISLHSKCVTLDVISRLAFNMNDTDVHEDESILREMTTRFMEDSSNSVLQLAAYFPPLSSILALLYKTFGAGKLITTVTEQLNKCIIDYYQMKIKEKFGDDSNAKTKPKMNILDYMLEQQEQGNLDELEIIGNAILVLLAGYETTATSLGFTLYLLAKHQDIQHKLRSEINACFEATSDNENYCQLENSRCELLDRVWYESLRVYPPVVSFVTRELSEEVNEIKLTKSPVCITKEMAVMIAVWSIHHDPRYWPNPYEFDPYRVDLPFPSNPTKNAAFVAFGQGPRNCIGANLALAEGRATIAALLRHYQLDLVATDQTNAETGLLKLVCPSVIVHPAQDICLRLSPINDGAKAQHI